MSIKKLYLVTMMKKYLAEELLVCWFIKVTILQFLFLLDEEVKKINPDFACGFYAPGIPQSWYHKGF